MNDISTQILALFLRFGYGSVFVGVMLDNFGLPIPGELVLILTGYMVEKGAFVLVPAILVAAAGAVLSDSAWFFAGRWGSQRFIKLYCKCSFGSRGCVERTEHNLRRFGASSLIYARFIPGFRTFAAPMAGMAGVPYRSFLLFDGIGATLWASLGVTTGLVFAREIPTLAGRIEDSGGPLFFFAAGTVVLFLLLKWWMRRRHGRAELASVEAKTLEPEHGGDKYSPAEPGALVCVPLKAAIGSANAAHDSGAILGFAHDQDLPSTTA